METITLQSEELRSENESAVTEASIFVVLTLSLGIAVRILEAWLGREEIRIQKSPGVSVTREEEFQSLQQQVGPESFFRIY